MDKLWPKYWNELSDHEQRLVNDKLWTDTRAIRFYPHDSEPLRGELEGLRSYNKFESDLRIYFAICHECRQKGFPSVNNCTDCSSMENDVVKLFAAGPHPIYDSLSRERRKRLRKKER